MKSSYMHPVVTPNGDATTLPLPKDNSKLTIKQIQTDDYIVTVDLNLNDEYILSLIEQGKANYLYVVECDSTQYRQRYIKNEAHIDIAIPRKKVVNKVIVLPFVIADEDIEYKNPAANAYYDDISFELSKGDVLVEFLGHKFDAEITYTVENIFKIVCNQDPAEKYVKYSLEDKIRIVLPNHDFHIFKGIKGDERYSTTIKASLVLNALLYALFNGDFDKESNESDDNWKKTIRAAVESGKLPNDCDLKNKESYPKLAQALLENVFSTLFSNIYEMPHTAEYETETI